MIDWDSMPLGEVPDVEIAKKYGVSNRGVGIARARRGIPPFGRVNWEDQPLGEVPDRELASKLGVPVKRVSGARYSKGKAFLGSEGRTCPCGTVFVPVKSELYCCRECKNAAKRDLSDPTCSTGIKELDVALSALGREIRKRVGRYDSGRTRSR